jgi:hypothetical protein
MEITLFYWKAPGCRKFSENVAAFANDAMWGPTAIGGKVKFYLLLCDLKNCH